MKKYRNIILFLAINLFVALLTGIHCKRDDSGKSKTTDNLKAHFNAEYTGREACVKCHELQHELFMGSDHDQAMQDATEEFMLGDFNDATFTHFGVTSRFYTKDGKYFVHTQGPEGVMEDYEIKYTFGVRPLQQYLIGFPGGRFQCLPICWDTRPVSQGGQKWFHIYGEEEIKPDDILFWTKINQNWNYMCAECHSTNLRKNYNFETKSYNTTWSEVDVSCEACHGPGSEHIKWADVVEKGGNPESFPNMGLTIRLKDNDNATWIFDPDSPTARRSVPRENDIVVQMCARCHSRRSVITEEYFHGGSLLNTHWPSLLEEALYFADGQIQDEVYVYASFMQSKMYQAGVNCKDCHEPHSGKIYVQGNALCYRCHMADEYGTREHHFHDPEKEGASCYECHMHERTYMQIDPRRDHSIRVPRPDLSGKLGTPNSCNQCHIDKTTEWATRYLREWYGDSLLEQKHYGETFYAGRNYYPGVEGDLIELAVNKENAPMIRATAVLLLGNYPSGETLEILTRTVTDSDPLIRYASLNTLQHSPQETILNLCLPRLTDSIKLVRIMAAYILAEIPEQKIPGNYTELRKKGIEEYKASLLINADHPNTHMNFGNLSMMQGDFTGAEASFLEALNIEPWLVAPYINLADLYRRQGREDEGEKMLKTALEKYPEMAPIHYSLGLLNVRKGDQETAIKYLKEAALQAPEEAHYSYVYGIGLNSRGQPLEAIQFLESALKNHPYNREILYALCTLNIEQGNLSKAETYAQKLLDYYPNDQEVRQLLNSLN